MNLKNCQEIIEKAIIDNTFIQKPQELYDPINYIMALGGKRIRPIMVILGCEIFGGDVSKAIKPALAIEFFHNFSLMHDDIMDSAPLRRGKSTVHTKYDINTAILSGDALLIKSCQFFEDLEPILYKNCIMLFSQTAILLCEGQQYDMNFENITEVTLDQYIQMITYKTGVLGAAAFKIGAMIAQANEEDAQALYNFGKYLGIAFQLQDDYLDVFGDEEKVGKKRAGDIWENKKTILYILAMLHGTSEDKQELEYWYKIKTENVDKVYGVEKIFKKAHVDKLVIGIINKYNNKALEELHKINIANDKKTPLIELINYLLNREN